MLDITDFHIFNELFKDPLQSYNQISKNVGVAPSTIDKRIFSMKKHGYLNNDQMVNDPVLGKREESEVIVAYNPHSIGLDRHHVIFEGLKSVDDYNKLKDFCDEHPYTHFRSEVYGNGRSLYAQFDLPRKINGKMQDLYRKLAYELDLSDLQLVQEEIVSYGEPNFIRYSSIDNRFFSEEEIQMRKRIEKPARRNHAISLLEEIWEEFRERNPTIETHKRIEYEPLKFDRLDGILMRELTINGKPKIVDLSKIYDKNKSTISRRISKIKDNHINKGILRFDRTKFGLNSYQLIIGKIRPQMRTEIDKLHYFIENTELPLLARVSRDAHNIMIYSTGSPHDTSDLTSFFWKFIDPSTYKINRMNTRSFARYYFYHLNHDGENDTVDGWNTELEYYYDTPMQIFN